MRARFWMRFLAVTGLCMAMTAMQAQLTTATITGTVTDDTGAVLPGAQVTATNTDTHFTRSVMSNAQGEYRIEFLPIGHYAVTAVAKSFSTSTQPDVELTLNVEQAVNFSLKPGSASETVTVTAAPPLVETTIPTLGRSIQNVEIDNLPLVNRDPYTLVTLAPGVQSESYNTALGFPQYVVYINGGTDNEVGSVSYYLDGGINMTFLRNTGNILPNPDALQEMNVMTNSYSALYGRSSSGVVNVVTKSGTNQMHGSVFEFFRSDKMNATPAFQLTRARLRRNQFGATLGGPIRKDRTFFFGSYAGFHDNQSTGLNGAIVPTPTEVIQQVYLISSGQSAHYHALQVDFEKRLSHSLSFKGYYTWSKTLESASLQNTTAQNNPQNFNFINEDYGPTDNDYRHRFVTSVVWKPGFLLTLECLPAQHGGWVDAVGDQQHS